MCAQNRQWVRDNPEKVRAKNQRRLARKASLPDNLTIKEWQQILATYNYACAYCGKKQSELNEVYEVLHQEHVTPLAHGGGYTANNIVPACRSCNAQKGARTPEQAGMSIRNNFYEYT